MEITLLSGGPPAEEDQGHYEGGGDSIPRDDPDGESEGLEFLGKAVQVEHIRLTLG